MPERLFGEDIPSHRSILLTRNRIQQRPDSYRTHGASAELARAKVARLACRGGESGEGSVGTAGGLGWDDRSQAHARWSCLMPFHPGERLIGLVLPEFLRYQEVRAIWTTEQGRQPGEEGFMISPSQIKTLFDLKPLAHEGGYFTEGYRSAETISLEALPERYSGPRSFSTAIYYLLTPETFSAMHRLRTDEVYHFYLGDPVEMVQLGPDGSTKILTLGQDIFNGMVVQTVVSKAVWQGSRLVPGGRFALLGTTMAPGFDPDDYEHGRRKYLIKSYPEAHDLIVALTRE